MLEIDAFDPLEEAVDKVLARLLAVADDVDAGILLELDGKLRRVAFRVREGLTGLHPRRPQLVGLGEPGGFGQASSDSGVEHRFPPEFVVDGRLAAL